VRSTGETRRILPECAAKYPEIISGKAPCASARPSSSTTSVLLGSLERERAKVLVLQHYLDGQAEQFWLSMKPDVKATYATASEALKRRFPERRVRLLDEPEEDDGLLAKEQAVSTMNDLVRGTMLCKEYADKANDLYTILGEEYSRRLANRFVDGIHDPALRDLVASQFDNNSAFPGALQAFWKCTTARRRIELAQQPKKEEALEKKPQGHVIDEGATGVLTETRNMVYQVGELFKELISG